MFTQPVHSFQHIFALLKKDLLLELRQQYTFYGILLYVASSIFVLYLAIEQPESTVWNGLFWIIQLFICVNAVAKSFLQETKGRMLYFYAIAGAQQFIVAKLLYNTFIMLLMSLISLFLFQVLLGNPLIHFWQFTGIVCIGSASLSLVFTMLAAIAAKAQQQASLMAIMGFPIIIPQLLLLMRISKAGLGEVFQAGALSDMIWLLCGLDVLVMVMAVILFPFLWKD
ncbi:MAG TPA: heme exporter protein CcmB [Agriterribacter sp.]|nr:heme exporter protein CcmB [Agriterribacter sp.]